MNYELRIPPTLEERTALRKSLKEFVQTQHLCPPVSLKQLEQLADEFIAHSQAETSSRHLHPWLMVEIHNQLWLPIVAGIPHERRLLMLPKCLSKYGECQAEFDAYGLLCHRCGRCNIPRLQDRAEQLGGLSIVAEGFTQVIELIENNVIDAVIGVSCLDSLEKAFPLLVGHAVPGLAVALNDSGCRDTHVDEDYVEELLTMLSDEATPTLLDHEAIREQVNRWFTRSELEQLMHPADNRTLDVCLDWMSGEGKRWRPYLLAAVWQALTGKTEMTDDVHRAAVAVECFHKASLIHDDIEDQDKTRYGQPTINALYGDAFAINAGDALLGLGYRILAQSNNAELLRLIAEAHIKLCKGQGEELSWNGTSVDMPFVMNIFRNKTVPAFEVSLMLGLSCTGNFAHLRPMLKTYSEALGIAYQLKDDLEDYMQDKVLATHPSAVLALQNEHPTWSGDEVRIELQRLTEHFHQEALDALNALDELELKRLLYQVTESMV
ncbi:MAG: polyprenyl synthetase family protein [Bacteroidaceae bacterium]|nr:polyprenyl synthetase family protein [Bacteroidaceae bacterium]